MGELYGPAIEQLTDYVIRCEPNAIACKVCDERAALVLLPCVDCHELLFRIRSPSLVID